MEDPAVAHHGMIRRYQHPEVGPLTLMGFPIRFGETPSRDGGPPPTLGQHTKEVLDELGYTESEVAELRRRNII